MSTATDSAVAVLADTARRDVETVDQKAIDVSHLMTQLVDQWRGVVAYHTAARAYQVDDVVAVRWFPARPGAIGSARLANQIEFGEQCERSIHRRDVHSRFAVTHAVGDLVSAEVGMIPCSEHVPHHLTGTRDTMMSAPQRSFEVHSASVRTLGRCRRTKFLLRLTCKTTTPDLRSAS